ncbi:hypothetical protein ONZ45_g5626 [Pleurotus djamor]|nr:hypothetical protein ONZ45_g5626 [Pleurotus djamor]
MADTQIETTDLEAYSQFPFDSDEEFKPKQGLETLVSGGALNGKDDAEKGEVMRLARVFFFNRKSGRNLGVDAVRDYELKLPTQPAPVTSEEEPRILSFSELQDLIQSGRVGEIPNNKVIPNILNDATPTESKAETRKKPWET